MNTAADLSGRVKSVPTLGVPVAEHADDHSWTCDGSVLIMPAPAQLRRTARHAIHRSAAAVVSGRGA